MSWWLHRFLPMETREKQHEGVDTYEECTPMIWPGFPTLSCWIKRSISRMVVHCLWERGQITGLWYLLTPCLYPAALSLWAICSDASHCEPFYLFFFTWALTESMTIDGRDDEMLGNRSGLASSMNSWQFASSPLITTTHSALCSSSAKGVVTGTSQG